MVPALAPTPSKLVIDDVAVLLGVQLCVLHGIRFSESWGLLANVILMLHWILTLSSNWLSRVGKKDETWIVSGRDPGQPLKMPTANWVRKQTQLRKCL
mmetsp:Transcript_161430/g.286347  ORF Transcript_161430/g.286347 Transcript_161430/m.286347 type:complete len:98 (-) Transcript_161430:1126-1419(-)